MDAPPLGPMVNGLTDGLGFPRPRPFFMRPRIGRNDPAVIALRGCAGRTPAFTQVETISDGSGARATASGPFFCNWHFGTMELCGSQAIASAFTPKAGRKKTFMVGGSGVYVMRRQGRFSKLGYALC